MTTRELTRVDPLEAWGLNPLGLTFGRLFDDVFARRGEDGGRLLAPPTDVWEDEDSLFVSVELPGMKKEDIRILVENGILTISGEKCASTEAAAPKAAEGTEGTEGAKDAGEVTYHRSECRYGAFSRTLVLPNGVDPDASDAEFRDGVLTVRLAKHEAAKPKTLKIR